MTIDPRAIIDPSATIADDVEIGPWTMIGPDVEIGSGTRVASHVVINGPSKIGRNNRIFQFASVGEECQDKKYAGEPTTLVMGDNNIIRENVTIHRGTVQDRGETRIGSNNLFMAYTHVAHDCVLGDNIIMANQSNLAGHVQVSDWAILGGGALVHQFCRIGPHAMVAGGAMVLKDVPAYVITSGFGQVSEPRGINIEGLKRRGFSKGTIMELRRAYKTIYREGLTLEEAIEALRQKAPSCAAIQPLIESLTNSQRGIMR